MEISNVISFLNQFPGIKAELVAVTGIKITSVYFLGYVLYETAKGGLDVSNLTTANSEVLFELESYAERSKQEGIAPYTILSAIYAPVLLETLTEKVDNSKVLQLPF